MAVSTTTRKQLLKFGVSGVTAVLVDYLVYLALYPYLGPNIAKGVSFLTGTMVAFVLNKYWTFEAKEFSGKQLMKFLILYGITLGLNIGTNHLCLIWFESIIFAFLCATGLSAVLNFIGQKFWVFKTSVI
ncbi:GtrA family protein [Zeaxanthinibacter sp. PT1]|uniref:GtrA family protein n=1 Tax=Zeaxanthinibacter TaxID=561554 RepID=UPI00234957B9|nr:GtrA family protein [Zeaxanthinibacter sp. PT1]MDC6350604.1 GtrA family protein [Zeaxanthinibacter sp. PT1]